MIPLYPRLCVLLCWGLSAFVCVSFLVGDFQRLLSPLLLTTIRERKYITPPPRGLRTFERKKLTRNESSWAIWTNHPKCCCSDPLLLWEPSRWDHRRKGGKHQSFNSNVFAFDFCVCQGCKFISFYLQGLQQRWHRGDKPLWTIAPAKATAWSQYTKALQMIIIGKTHNT